MGTTSSHSSRIEGAERVHALALNASRIAANALTGSRAIAGLVLAARPSLTMALLAIATDWVDGALARRGGEASYGARFDLEADSLLTLGLAVAAVRRGAGCWVLLAPAARYATVALRDPATLTTDEIRWDRLTGIAQMGVLTAFLAPSPFRLIAAFTGPMIAARCATIAAVITPGAVHSMPTKRPAEARLVPMEDR